MMHGCGRAVSAHCPGRLADSTLTAANCSSNLMASIFLGAQDADLGTAGPTVLNLPGSTPSELVFIGGKQGIVYLLDR